MRALNQLSVGLVSCNVLLLHRHNEIGNLPTFETGLRRSDQGATDSRWAWEFIIPLVFNWRKKDLEDDVHRYTGATD